MGMGKIRTSIELFKASWGVIKQDRELLWLPVLSALAALGTVLLFAVPVVATIGLDVGNLSGNQELSPGPVTYVLLFLAYLALAFVSIFFNAALVHASNERMSGGDPTVGSAISGAMGRLNRIGPWAIVSATVSMIIRQIQERAGFLGAILGFLAGMAWAAVTFLVLPILVIEDVGVTDALKRSTALLKKAWGEGLAGHVGLGLIGFLAVLPLILIAGLGMFSGTIAIAVPAILIAVLGIIGVSIVVSALSVVYQTALYRFATDQPVSSFSPGLMENAFYAKRGRR